MTFLTALEIFNYILVLLFGLFLSTFIAGGWKNRTQKRIIFVLCPIFLLIQGICLVLWNVNTVERLYPLITHLPLVLILILPLKKRIGVAMVSVCTAYLCCQIPRWVQLSLLAITHSPLAAEICYTLSIFPIFYLLYRYFVQTAHDAMTYTTQSLLLFGSLPVAYYFFDYTTAVYSDALHVGIHALNEFLPTALIVFYVLFLTAYHGQEQKRTQAELQSSMLEAELKQSAVELESLRLAETQTAIYQHDLRHHLNAINAFLSSGNPRQAEEYIKQVQADVEAIAPKRYCEHELINLLCSAFAAKAEHLDVDLSIHASAPQELSIAETELCSLLSNALENALHAVSCSALPKKWIEFYCGTELGKLLIEVKNPYTGTVILRDGLPVSDHDGHGYGCQSIKSIVDRNGGICGFEADGTLFTLQIVLPISRTLTEQRTTAPHT